MKFSIVVPTYNRPQELAKCLQTLKGQGDDYEIVLADNSSNDETESLVKSLDFPRLRYVKNPPIGMRANWEAGISAATGDYVTVLGDDDGMMPNALLIAKQALDLVGEANVDVLRWFPHMYFWTNSTVPHKSGLLYVHRAYNEVVPFDPLEQAVRFYKDVETPGAFEILPMIYNSFVRRSIIEKVVADTGVYLHNNCVDVWSGIVNGVYCKGGYHLKYPLTIRGNSGKSNGANFRGSNWTRHYEEYKEDETKHMHQNLIPSSTLAIHTTNARLDGIRLFPKQYGGIEIRIESMIKCMLTEITENPDRRAHILSDMKELAKKFNVELDFSKEAKIELAHPQKTWGWQTDLLVVNCAMFGVDDIYAASIVVKAITA